MNYNDILRWMYEDVEELLNGNIEHDPIVEDTLGIISKWRDRAYDLSEASA